MDSKLTVKLDKQVIDRAKVYASANNKSLSRLIESYLKSIVIKDNDDNMDEIQISPFVKSLSSGFAIPSDIDYKKEYSNYLIEKYK